ncbi:Imm26 family immunity protein [Janthinobacterium sp. HLX7-2]|uniref:Imm26 family immunity protein n=1 Tax=Janthinobacterium sp. HLX7-2 TaxID=1259331 RepID=UPI003F27EF1D
MKSLPYREGSWFAVPLPGGGYAVGVVARTAPAGRIMLAYMFGPKRETLPSLDELEGLQPAQAVRRLRTGDMALLNERWPLLGDSGHWNRAAWPMPAFIRRNESLQRAWRASYADANPAKLDREESIAFDTPGMESDSLYGYGATELLMNKLLAPVQAPA